MCVCVCVCLGGGGGGRGRQADASLTSHRTSSPRQQRQEGPHPFLLHVCLATRTTQPCCPSTRVHLLADLRFTSMYTTPQAAGQRGKGPHLPSQSILLQQARGSSLQEAKRSRGGGGGGAASTTYLAAHQSQAASSSSTAL